MDVETAKKLAQEKLIEMQAEIGLQLAFLSDEPSFQDDGWLFFYNTQLSIETGNPLDGLAGNGPLKVMNDGKIILLGSSD